MRLCNALVLLSSAPLVVLAGGLPRFFHGEKPALALMGFEIVISVAAVLGIAWGKPRAREIPDSGPALGLACIAGTILLASALGWQGANRNLAGHSLTPLLGARTIISLAMLAASAGLVLNRDRRSWRLFALGVALIVPVAGLAAAMVLPAARGAIDRLMSHTFLAFTLATIGFVGCAVLLAVGGHCVIRAFEMGRPDSRS
jgi:hypothetical protein